MTTVHLLIKHPRNPYGGGYSQHGTVTDIYPDRKPAEDAAARLNARAAHFLWSVKTKLVKQSKEAA